MSELPPPELPSLDYAFLADYAAVQPQGTLTVVGASFTFMQVERFPLARQLGIAGRLRVAEGADPVAMTITFRGPGDDAPELAVEMLATHGPERAYEGRVGILFAVNTAVPILEPGLHRFTIQLDGKAVRVLAFDAEAIS